jgi:hypothetical protein
MESNASAGRGDERPRHIVLRIEKSISIERKRVFLFEVRFDIMTLMTASTGIMI